MKIAVIPGDGIGPDIIRESIKVLDVIAKKYNHTFEYDYIDMGGVSIDKTGQALTSEALVLAQDADAVLLGAVGGAAWDRGRVRPEDGLLALRKGLGVYANLRPAVLYSELKSSCPLREFISEKGIDLLIVRELTGGIYFGEKGRSNDGLSAYDVEKYYKYEIERILQKALENARMRRQRITLVDKANILESSRFWRETATEFFKNKTDIDLNYMYVDNASMQLIKDPSQFDVIVTNNIFGDILSDEASMLTGSIGMLPSASLGDNKKGLYEPIHGSAPDIAGLGIANPLATILAASMMLEYSFELTKEAEAIRKAVKMFLACGYRTKDLATNSSFVSTVEAGDLICEKLLNE